MRTKSGFLYNKAKRIFLKRKCKDHKAKVRPEKEKTFRKDGILGYENKYDFDTQKGDRTLQAGRRTQRHKHKRENTRHLCKTRSPMHENRARGSAPATASA